MSTTDPRNLPAAAAVPGTVQPSTDPHPDAARTTVVSMLSAAGLPATPDEVEGYLAAYPLLTQGIDSLYAIPDCRYESPGLIFTATPVFAEWS